MYWNVFEESVMYLCILKYKKIKVSKIFSFMISLTLKF